MQNNEFLTVGEARELLGVSRQKMTNLISDGVFHLTLSKRDKRVRLIKRSEVESFLRDEPKKRAA